MSPLLYFMGQKSQITLLLSVVSPTEADVRHGKFHPWERQRYSTMECFSTLAFSRKYDFILARLLM